jgi:hypothetical protein
MPAPSRNPAARAAYQRAYRAKNGRNLEAERPRQRARSRAMRRLAAEYPDRFAQLLAEETANDKAADTADT